MKTTRVIAVAILVIAFTALFTISVVGQNGLQGFVTNGVAYPLPDRLTMMGSETNFLDWIATAWKRDTNVNVVVGPAASWVDSQGHPGTVAPVVQPTYFNSYQEFLDWVPTSQKWLYDDLSKLTDQNSSVTYRFGFGLSFKDQPSLTGTAIILFGKVNHLSEMATEDLSNLSMTYCAAPLRIDNLEGFTVRVETDSTRFLSEPDQNTLYLFNWTSGTKSVLQKALTTSVPKEYTSPYCVLFNEWYSTNSYPARFTITASGVTKTYTQSGEEVNQTTGLIQILPATINVSARNGSYTVVETSDDFQTWVPFTEIDGFTGETSVKIPLYPSMPHQFFRARAW